MKVSDVCRKWYIRRHLLPIEIEVWRHGGLDLRLREIVALCVLSRFPRFDVRDADVIAALAKFVKDRPSRGFWKCRKMLRREGQPWNHKRIYRVYRAMGLHLRRPVKKRLPKRELSPVVRPKLSRLCVVGGLHVRYVVERATFSHIPRRRRLQP